MRSLRSFEEPFLAEIAAQPDAIRRAADGFLGQRGLLEDIREAAAAATTIGPPRGDTCRARTCAPRR